MTPGQDASQEFKERLAKRLYECHFEERWEDLHPQGIERAMWMGMAQAAIEMFEHEAMR